MPEELVHHPDCGFWYDNYPWECECGLTSSILLHPRLQPWPKSEWEAWKAEVEAARKQVK